MTEIISRVWRALTHLVRHLLGLGSGGLVRGVEFVENWLTQTKHAQYGLAVTRILLGLTGIGLLLTNWRTRLYAFGSGSAWNGEANERISDFPKIWIFSYFDRVALDDTGFTLSYLVLIALAIAVTIGWRTKIILPVFFVAWVSFIEITDSLGDQGDNMYRITLLTLLFADTASTWSVDARRRDRPRTGSQLQRIWQGETFVPGWLSNMAHNLAIVTVATHVCFVYASGALYKAGGAPWQEGYAIYNPLSTMRFGPWPELTELFTAWSPMVTAISWTSIILQMSFPMMLLKRFTRVIALLGIGSFHIGIAVLMGLPWFSLAMIAIDAIFIRDVTWKKMFDGLVASWRESGGGGPPPDASASLQTDNMALSAAKAAP